MGLAPSLPSSDKAVSSGVTASGLEWAGLSMQGWREQNEDALFAAAPLASDAFAFGVLDGHGGDFAARRCAERLPAELARAGSTGAAAMTAAFEALDTELAAGGACRVCGCTALVAAVTAAEVVVANAGDCRAVLCNAGKAVELSRDHKPELKSERCRIEAAGGFVKRQQVTKHFAISRVNGGLSVARALGDFAYKADPTRGPREQLLVATPEVVRRARASGDEFLLLACDGVWDVVGSQEAVDVVRAGLKEGRSPEEALAALLDYCLPEDLETTRGIGGDNMTALLVLLSEERCFEADSA